MGSGVISLNVYDHQPEQCYRNQIWHESHLLVSFSKKKAFYIAEPILIERKSFIG